MRTGTRRALRLAPLYKHATLRIACPKTAIAGCAGTVRLNHLEPAVFPVRPGKRLKLVLPARGLHGRVRVTALSIEPWGGKATTRKTLHAA